MISLRPGILILSAGRRVALTRAFRRAAQRTKSRVWTADINPALSAACQDNGSFVKLPHVSSPEFPETLLDTCISCDIGVVIPTLDTELFPLAQLRPSFLDQGIGLIVSDPDIVSASRDKRKTPLYFEQFGITSPKIFDREAIQYPAFAKPFDGSLSRNVSLLRSSSDLSERILQTPNIMFMQYVAPENHDEFTCDAYYSKHGTLCCVVPRQRIEVRGGEISKGITRRNELVTLFFRKLNSIPGARGCLTFQFFLNKLNRSAYLIEVNPRFGGGYPMSLAAGAEYPSWIVAEYLCGDKINVFNDWTEDLVALRYDSQVIVSHS